MRTHFLLVRVFAFLALLLFAPQVYARGSLVMINPPREPARLNT